jgi:4-amino-4-deoxy-L-arabinose transferase-like glycosyltransferase
MYGLFDLDEGYYAAVVAEMNRRSEWITPYFNGKPWFEKPILLYWFAKPSVSLFGEAVGPRLPSVLATVALLYLVGRYLHRRVSAVAACWGMATLGTSLLIIGLGRMMMTDALLDLSLCGAFLSFYESLVGHKAWRVLTAFCLGVAVLAKGPVSLPLFIALVVWTYIKEKDRRPDFRGYWLLGSLALAATVCIWYLPAYLENGQVFVQKFFIEQNLQRFGGGDEAHKVPIVLWPIYYPVVLFVGMFPWSVGLVKRWRLAFREGSELERYLARWAMVILVFFTVSGTKLPHYILPAVPALAMISAVSYAKTKPFDLRLTIGLSVGYCVLANAIFMLWYRQSGFLEVHADARMINHAVSGRGAVLTYQLARVSNSKGLSLNDTSNPSLGFYLDLKRLTFQDISSLPDLESALKTTAGPRFILTRPGRLSSTDLEALAGEGDKLTPLTQVTGASKYEVYSVGE